MEKKLQKKQSKQQKKLLIIWRYWFLISRNKIKKLILIKVLNILDFLSNNKIVSSKSEARRAIANKGLKIDNKIINDEKKN